MVMKSILGCRAQIPVPLMLTPGLAGNFIVLNGKQGGQIYMSPIRRPSDHQYTNEHVLDTTRYMSMATCRRAIGSSGERARHRHCQLQVAPRSYFLSAWRRCHFEFCFLQVVQISMCSYQLSITTRGNARAELKSEKTQKKLIAISKQCICRKQ